jgi:hypothetical protein
MSTQEDIIIKHLQTAMTGILAPRGTAQTIAHAFDLLTILRNERISWAKIADLFNTAREEQAEQSGSAVDQAKATPSTLCRLYNLQKGRIELASARGNSSIKPDVSLSKLLGLEPDNSQCVNQPRKPADPRSSIGSATTGQPRDGPRAPVERSKLLRRLENSQDRKTNISKIIKEEFDD